jgi:hypothetical protein
MTDVHAQSALRVPLFKRGSRTPDAWHTLIFPEDGQRFHGENGNIHTLISAVTAIIPGVPAPVELWAIVEGDPSEADVSGIDVAEAYGMGTAPQSSF